MALIRQARLSLSTFLGGALASILPVIFSTSQTASYVWGSFAIYIFMLYGVIYNGILVFVYMSEKDMYKVCIDERVSLRAYVYHTVCAFVRASCARACVCVCVCVCVLDNNYFKGILYLRVLNLKSS